MDSLMAVELRNRLLGQFGSAFTITVAAVFDCSTIGSLAEYLAGQVARSVEVQSVGVLAPSHDRRKQHVLYRFHVHDETLRIPPAG